MLPWLVGGGLFLGTVLLFSRSLGYDFLNYDDPAYLTNNAHVRAGLTWEGFRWAFAGRADYWHPLTWLSHMLDWQLFGAQATGHRCVSVLWHAANAVLVFHVLRRLTGAFWTCALSAALFAWHPLRVESVVWITERKDVMSGCFFLLTLWAYAGYVECRRTGRPAWGRYALTLALYLADLMCKPMVVSLPVVLLILDCWPLGRFSPAPPGAWWRAHRGTLQEKLPFFLLAGIISAVTVLMQRQHGAFVLDLPLGDRLGNAVVSVVRYAGKFFWPADLVVCYPHPGHWPAMTVAAAALLLAACGMLAWRRRQAQPWLAAGGLWFLATLLPALGVVQVGFQAMADRYTYIPILGWQLALLWTLREIRGLRPAAPALGAVVLAACAVMTWRQQAVWRDSAALFGHAIAVDEANPFAHAFLAYTLLGLDQPEAAARHAARALELEPRNFVARYSLAEARAQQGRWADADDNLRRLLAENPADATGRNLHARVLLELGRNDEAMAEFNLAFAAQPDLRDSALDLARAALGRGQPAGALAYTAAVLAGDDRNADARFLRARDLDSFCRLFEALAEVTQLLQQQPDLPAAHTLAGLILAGTRRPAEALPHLEAALARLPDDPDTLAGYGRALEQLGRRDDATAAFQRAQAAAPGRPDLHRAWGDVLARRGDLTGAEQAYRKALALQPADAEAHAALGFLLVLRHQPAEAAAHWQEALRLRPDFPGLRERLQRLQP